MRIKTLLDNDLPAVWSEHLNLRNLTRACHCRNTLWFPLLIFWYSAVTPAHLKQLKLPVSSASTAWGPSMATMSMTTAATLTPPHRSATWWMRMLTASPPSLRCRAFTSVLSRIFKNISSNGYTASVHGCDDELFICEGLNNECVDQSFAGVTYWTCCCDGNL